MPATPPSQQPMPPTDPAEHERRRHLRAALPISARLSLPDGNELEAELVDISAGGAKLRCPAATVPAEGESVIFYAAEIGRMEATIVRRSENTVALAFPKDIGAVTRMSDALTWALNAEASEDRRNADRFGGKMDVTVILPDGAALPCRLLDASPEGASLELDVPVAIGDTLEVGRMTARVVRRHAEGVGVVFLAPSRTR